MSIDGDDMDSAVEDIEQANPDEKRRTQAFWILVVTFASVIIGVALLIAFDFIDFLIEIVIEANLGWIVEYAVAGLVALFFAFITTAFFIWLPGNFRSAIVNAAAGIAESRGRVERDDNEE
jgi:hypothetical protein